MQLDDTDITLRRDYFPVGTSKRARYSEVRAVQAQPMGWWTGKGRLWGTSDPRYWFPLDRHRCRKSKFVTLDVGRRIKPMFTPDDPDMVVDIISHRIGQPG